MRRRPVKDAVYPINISAARKIVSSLKIYDKSIRNGFPPMSFN